MRFWTREINYAFFTKTFVSMQFTLRKKPHDHNSLNKCAFITHALLL